MDLFSWAGMGEFIRQEHSLTGLAGNFGLSNVITLVLVRRYRDSNGNPHQEILEIPNLVLTISNPASGQSMSGIEIENSEIQIEGISKTISRDWLSATGVSFWLGSKVINGVVEGGQEYQFVTINDTSPTAWSITLQKTPDERKFD